LPSLSETATRAGARAGWTALHTFLGAIGAQALFSLDASALLAAVAAAIGAAANVLRDVAASRARKLKQKREQQ
jgi:uncharacterized protein (DUF2062 family)